MIWMMRLHAAFALMMRRSFLRLEDDEEVDQSYNQWCLCTVQRLGLEMPIVKCLLGALKSSTELLLPLR